MTYRSVGERFLSQCEASGPRAAFRAPLHDGGWRSLTWAETATQARELAAGLLALGLRPEQRVGIAATTRIEWVLADLAVTLAGGATTTVYPSTNAEDVAYILGDCTAAVVFAEDAGQLAKLRRGSGFVGDVHTVVLFDGDTGDDPDGADVLSLDGLAELGRRHLGEHPDAVERALAALTPDHLATII
jgi:long-chain acyl-CoA synthetase